MSDDIFERSSAFFTSLQEEIIAELEAIDGSTKFTHDDWTRPEPDWSGDGPVLAGGGRTRVLEGGDVFEKAGVNFSLVRGRFSEEFAASMPGEGRMFQATGISIVIHPRNPYVPTVHMNYRRLQRDSGGWFGGGADLTPYYLDPADAVHFHRVHRDACAAHDVADYDAFKAKCDAYFHLPHRDEARGVGGIFFDYLHDDPEATFAFVQDAGAAFMKAYAPIARRHKDRLYTDRERQWLRVRRGRYVEFNLIHDRGTTFGLRTGGRTESILMSLPPDVAWHYRHEPEPDSPEAALLEWIKPRDWAKGVGEGNIKKSS